MKVGDKVWVFEENRRRYKQDEKGRSVGGPIWREHWVERTVIGENRINFLISIWSVNREIPSEWDLKNAIRVPKKGPMPWGIVASEEELDRKAWFHDNHYKIKEAVGQVYDYDTLKKVAELIGYKE